jgi:23S rRNA (uridine2552-2'-O)-methyltransferase
MTSSRSHPLKTRVRVKGGRTPAQKRWLDRQLNDPYVARAKREGWRSRAAFKLIELDDKYRLLKPGSRVVDLGAAPGGWSQVAAKRVGAFSGEVDAGSPQKMRLIKENQSEFRVQPNGIRSGAGEGRGRVVAIDLLDMPPTAGVDFLALDFLDPAAPERLKAMLGGEADIVLSDMAANATGHRQTDHLKIMALAEAAALFAREVLKEGGAFLCKVLRGGTEAALLAELKRDFATVKHVKPAASRADSAELYLLAMGFRHPPA